MQTLDVLVIEDRPGVAADDIDVLEAAGHRVHRCYEHLDRSFPCRVLDGRPCPVDEGVDVALLVTRGVATRPTPSEAGVSCAIRARVPLVEDGSDVRDPYARLLSGRVAGDPAHACESAADLLRRRLRDELRDLAAALAAAAQPGDMAGIDPGAFDLELRRTDGHVRLTITGPDVSTRLRNHLAVRLLAISTRNRLPGNQFDVGYRVA